MTATPLDMGHPQRVGTTKSLPLKVPNFLTAHHQSPSSLTSITMAVFHADLGWLVPDHFSFFLCMLQTETTGIHGMFFTGQMPFLSPNQERQSTKN